ncbi:MAG: BLUF domain-containing protein, partial [Sphingomicrobium sp.]
QVIEGRRQAVEALYGRIRGDHRHIAVTTLVKRNVQVRCFDGWAMAYRRDTRLGVFDSFPVVLGYLTDQVADLRLRGQIRQFAKSFIVQPVANTPELWRMAS